MSSISSRGAGQPGPGSPEGQGPGGQAQLPPWRVWQRSLQPGSSVPEPDGPGSAGVGYAYLSYMIGGMVLYGGIGWLVGRWTHLPLLFPVGMLAGLALAIVLIIFRVTRP
jgi:ATP synthase protein I